MITKKVSGSKLVHVENLDEKQILENTAAIEKCAERLDQFGKQLRKERINEVKNAVAEDDIT